MHVLVSDMSLLANLIAGVLLIESLTQCHATLVLQSATIISATLVDEMQGR